MVIQALEEVVESKETAKVLTEIAALDLVEVFSPERVTKELKRFGMRAGAAIDLEEMKPDGGERWDLDKDMDFKEAMDLIAWEQPWLVTSSPPCTTFSPLRNLSNFKRSPEKVAEEEMLGVQRLRRAIACCELQMSLGGYFLHEHPRGSSSWQDEAVTALTSKPTVRVVQSPMCKFGMKQKNDAGELLHVRKDTLWATNSEEIAKELEGVCKNKLHGRESSSACSFGGEEQG